ncbi:MAG: anti-sigma factor family protein [Phycisphaerae bacterium]
MSHEEFEQLLPEALGYELDPERQRRFEKLLNDYPDLRDEYDRLVAVRSRLEQTPSAEALSERSERKMTTHRGGQPRKVTAWVRIAASWLLAFAGGYTTHAMFNANRTGEVRVESPALVSENPSDATSQSPTLSPPVSDEGQTMHDAIREARLRGPRRSMLSQCMVAMLKSAGS